MGRPDRGLLEEAEQKMRAAIAKETEANTLQREVGFEYCRYIYWIID